MRYFRCRNCGMLVKSDTSPSNVTKQCNPGVLHSFQDLGEIGDTMYECKHCGIRLNFNRTPNSTGDCHKSNYHDWHESSGNPRNITFSTQESMKNKHSFQRGWFNIFNSVKNLAFVIGIIFFGATILWTILKGLFEDHPIPFIIVAVVIVGLLVLWIISKIKKHK